MPLRRPAAARPGILKALQTIGQAKNLSANLKAETPRGPRNKFFMEANQSDSPRNIASRIPEARKAGLRERERRGQHSLERPGGGRIWPLDWCSGARDQRGKPASMAAHEPGGQSLSWNQGGERIREGRGDWFGLSAGGEYERGDRDRALGRELLRSTSKPTRSCGREPRSPPESNAVRLLPRPKFCRSSRSPIPRRRSTGASKKEKVQETAGWTPARTPLDPSYRRPIKIRMSQKRKASSSSGSTTRSSSTSEDRSSDHQVHRVAKKLPGYLARCCCKEASNLLAQDVGEEGSTYVVMQKYYRQILLRRGGSRPLLREMATLSWGMDLLLQGKILQLADLLAQRLKALELIQQGTTGDLAAQLELLPKESQGLSSQAEARIAKSEFFQETKLANQLKGKGKRPFAPLLPKGKKAKERERVGTREGQKARKETSHRARWWK